MTKDLKTAYPKHCQLANYHKLAMHCLNIKPQKVAKNKKVYLQDEAVLEKRKKS